MPPESLQVTGKDEVLVSPEKKRQIRADLTYFQLFAFQGPRITTGDGRRSLDQLDEKDVKHEYASFRTDEWGGNAVAMVDHGLIGLQRTSDSRILRFYPLIEPVFPKISINSDPRMFLKERNGLIVLETVLDDGGVSVLMAGYANYEQIRHNCPTPTGFELVFSDLRAANRFFENLRKNPTATVNEYALAAIGGVDGGRHAAFGGKWPSDLRYLGVRRYNDEMYQSEVTDRGVRVIKHYDNIEELAGEIEEKEAKKPVRPRPQAAGAAVPPNISYEPPKPPGYYKGESKIVIPRRPEGYFSLVAKYGHKGYDGLNMEAQGNAPPPAEALTPTGSRRIKTPGEMAFMTPGNEARQFIFGLSHPAYVIKSGERCLLSVGFPFSPVDSGTGQKLLDPNWVEVKKGYQVIVRRGEGERFTVGTDDRNKIITASLPPQFTEKDGRKHDFSDIKGGANKQERHFILRLAQSGHAQIENWDPEFGVAVPAEAAASAAKSGEEDVQKEKDEMTEKLVISVGAATSVGKVREHNEDSLAVMGANVFGEKFKVDSGLYVVADGMGGHGAGEVASALAVETIQRGYSAGPKAGENDEEFLKRLVSEANAAVFAKRQDGKDKTDMGTTIVAALRHGERTVVAWVGDSRGYRIKPDGIVERLTIDHSLVQRLLDTKEITPAEAAVHPQRNVIYRTVGDKPKVEIDVATADLKPGDKLLLCCDGLSGMVSDAEMAKIVNQARTSQAAAEQLIAAANAAGGEDNISAIVVRNVEGSPAKKEAAGAKTEGVKTEKEWQSEIKKMLEDPIARTVYGRTGSVTAAAVAYERRAEISSGKMTKEQYMALVKRVLEAAKTS